MEVWSTSVFHRLHDFDNNTKLDGLELYQALAHSLPYEVIGGHEVDVIETNGKTESEIEKLKTDIEHDFYAGKLLRI